jgi:hypothetical protein
MTPRSQVLTVIVAAASVRLSGQTVSFSVPAAGGVLARACAFLQRNQKSGSIWSIDTGRRLDFGLTRFTFLSEGLMRSHHMPLQFQYGL